MSAKQRLNFSSQNGQMDFPSVGYIIGALHHVPPLSLCLAFIYQFALLFFFGFSGF